MFEKKKYAQFYTVSNLNGNLGREREREREREEALIGMRNGVTG